MITFFHNSEDYIEVFNPKSDNRPTFYWFSDRYHSHIGVNVKHRYFYLFVKNPKQDNIELRTRGEELDFNGLWEYYLEYKVERDKLYNQGIYDKYIEPPIIMSFSSITPDLVAEYDEVRDLFTIIKPDKYKGRELKFQKALDFVNIKLTTEILPQINKSLPFIDPKETKGKYIYDGWKPMVTDEMGVWL